MSWSRAVCWMPTWNKAHEGVGLEHLLLDQRAADSVVLAVDEERGPFRLTYHLVWDDAWRLREAELVVATDRSTQSLSLRTDGQGHWRHNDGRTCGDLDGCASQATAADGRRVQSDCGQRATLHAVTT
jgi:uncharacterized protein